MNTYTREDATRNIELKESNKYQLGLMDKQLYRLGKLVIKTMNDNNKGRALPLVDIETLIAELYEAYSVLQNK